MNRFRLSHFCRKTEFFDGYPRIADIYTLLISVRFSAGNDLTIPVFQGTLTTLQSEKVFIMTLKQKYARLTVLCTVVYFTSYISRINLAAVMVELIQSGFAEKQTAALALTLCSVTYGVGQVLSGWLGDRFKPQNIILLGFALTASMNLSVSFLQGPALLPVLWAINGFAQACMWPPLLSILTAQLPQEQYSRACVWVSQGSAFGTIFVYACSPLLIRWGSFRTVFAFSGIAALTVAVIWKVFYERLFGKSAAAGMQAAVHEEAPVKEFFHRHALLLMGFIMLGIVLQGSLRDGVTNWMPTFVSESFGLDSSSAILTGVLLPIFQIPCTEAAAWLQRKQIPNEVSAAGVIFTLGAISSVLLFVFMDRSVLITALLMAMLVGCMHGVNFMLISLSPRQFRRFGHVSLISGTLNSCTYIGSSLSTYGFALLSDSMGWQGTSLLWAGIAATGAVVCLCIAKKWGAFRQASH